MASILPDIAIPQSVVSDTTQHIVTYGTELAYNFELDDFIYINGKPLQVTGIEALKIWIEKALRTARYRYLAYDFGYGCEIEELIGYDLPRVLLESEVPRMIREALIYDDRIANVRDFVLERGADWLKVSFAVDTFDGRVLEGVHDYNV